MPAPTRRPRRPRAARVGTRLVALGVVAAGVLAACAANPDPDARVATGSAPRAGAGQARAITGSTTADGTSGTGTGATTASTPQGDASTTSVPGDAAATTGASTTSSTTPTGGPVTVAFGGDVHSEPPIAGVLASGQNPLQFVAPLLTQADVALVNLETVVSPKGKARQKKYTFRSPTSLLTSIKAAGVDGVSVANNHSFDFGADAFQDSLANAKAAGLVPVGGGATEAEAYGPGIFEANGTKVAVLGIAKVGPDWVSDRAVGDGGGTTNGRDVARVTQWIRAAKQQAPIVIAFIHWGVELARCPTPEDRQLAQAMLDAGASAVIGAHPHVLQGISQDAGKLVAWSLGNFVFYAKRDVARNTGVLTVTFNGDGTVQGYEFAPARIDGYGRPVPLTGDAATRLAAEVKSLTPGQGACPG